MIGFHWLRVAKKSVPIIAFYTSSCFYEWLVMPFGLTNASTYFIDIMNHVFRDQLKKFTLVFINDISVYSRMKEEHKTLKDCT